LASHRAAAVIRAQTFHLERARERELHWVSSLLPLFGAVNIAGGGVGTRQGTRVGGDWGAKVTLSRAYTKTLSNSGYVLMYCLITKITQDNISMIKTFDKI
jgi:hypothetical protein